MKKIKKQKIRRRNIRLAVQYFLLSAFMGICITLFVSPIVLVFNLIGK